ncbi:accessory factor UbiK family protein [Marinihelvus fidelis]|uniref:Ubiquinone biosynthesis accessory factor UbiK n=1 Tax=Marinihelvus fidelis TaxID=2613842 RepID=A0A5N0TBT6_9GAMM|nr:accessory factor UbiK family protein [Marinihelvus fidelis]KAA9131286.1 accessory factor UbiK family protein [Marinihelvus fidelis]
MIDMQKIDELARKLGDALPPGARRMRDDLEKQFRGVLSKGLGAMDLVTREEFDIQKAALDRAKAELASLEQRLAALESQKDS